MLKIYFLLCFLAVTGIVGSLNEICRPHENDNGCGELERCVGINQTYYQCQCIRGAFPIDNKCSKEPVNPTTNSSSQRSDPGSSSGSSVAVGLLVPTFLIILGGIGFFFAKRYGLLPCRQNRYGNVLVTREEEDDDDPPIA